MHENVDISKDLQQTKLLFDSLLLTQGGGAKGGSSSGGDNALFEIANDILTKVHVPDFHCLVHLQQLICYNLYTEHCLCLLFFCKFPSASRQFRHRGCALKVPSALRGEYEHCAGPGDGALQHVCTVTHSIASVIPRAISNQDITWLFLCCSPHLCPLCQAVRDHPCEHPKPAEGH